jgi:hypothetical protein
MLPSYFFSVNITKEVCYTDFAACNTWSELHNHITLRLTLCSNLAIETESASCSRHADTRILLFRNMF